MGSQIILPNVSYVHKNGRSIRLFSLYQTKLKTALNTKCNEYDLAVLRFPKTSASP